MSSAMSNPVPGQRICRHCGNGLVATAVVCTSCGSPVGKVKSKPAAVVLAVFLSFWSWLYTYSKNGWKFWVGLALTIIGFASGRQGGGLILLGVWMWSVVDNAVKPTTYYTSYEI